MMPQSENIAGARPREKQAAAGKRTRQKNRETRNSPPEQNGPPDGRPANICPKNRRRSGIKTATQTARRRGDHKSAAAGKSGLKNKLPEGGPKEKSAKPGPPVPRSPIRQNRQEAAVPDQHMALRLKGRCLISIGLFFAPWRIPFKTFKKRRKIFWE